MNINKYINRFLLFLLFIPYFGPMILYFFRGVEIFATNSKKEIFHILKYAFLAWGSIALFDFLFSLIINDLLDVYVKNVIAWLEIYIMMELFGILIWRRRRKIEMQKMKNEVPQ